MHVLIATTGVLSPSPVVEFTKHLIGEDGKVSVTTVIGVPRPFLELLREDRWHPLADENGEWSTQEDALIARYVEERGRKLTEPVLNSLLAAGIEATALFLEGDDPAATISEAANRLGADVVVLGATRQIFDQSAWESVSARVMIESGKPVLVVPPLPKEAVEEPAERE